jgi:hypothetical protein
MATTPTTHRDSLDATDTRPALDAIHVPENIRAPDPEPVQALARSIHVRGLIVPLVVRPTDTAARSPGLTEVRVVVRDAAGEDADRAIAYLDADGEAWLPTVPATYRLTCLIHPTTMGHTLRVRR